MTYSVKDLELTVRILKKFRQMQKDIVTVRPSHDPDVIKAFDIAVPILEAELRTAIEREVISDERKDDIIRSLLGEYCEGITEWGLEALKGIITPEELNHYGYDFSEIETHD